MKELDYIKKYYGEEFMHKCREWFPTVLSYPNELKHIISTNFAENKDLYFDLKYNGQIDTFINFVKTKSASIHKKINEENIKKTTKTPTEIMDSVGYDLKECKSESDIQSYRHFYKRNDDLEIEYIDGDDIKPWEGEELCTFEGGRLNNWHVYFAVRKDVDQIRRIDYPLPGEDFTEIGGKKFDDVKDEYAHKFYQNESYNNLSKEQKLMVLRDNDYATSVISIQISKNTRHDISIKNRYNHHLPNEINPDATLGNNLNNIHPELKYAFENELNLQIENCLRNENFQMPNYILGEDKRLYKYNSEIDGMYFCPNNIVIDDSYEYEIKKYDNERYIVSDIGVIFDLKKKTVKNFHDYSHPLIDNEALPSTLTDIQKFEISVDKLNNTKTLTIFFENKKKNNTIIKFNKKNCIVEIIDPNLKTMPQNYIQESTYLKSVTFENLKLMNDKCFKRVENLENINMPNLTNIGDNCFKNSPKLKNLELKNLKYLGKSCFCEANSLETLNLKNLKIMDEQCFCFVNSLSSLSAENLKIIGTSCFNYADSLTQLNLPKAKSMNPFVFFNANSLKEINMPNLTTLKSNCFRFVSNLNKVNLENLYSMGDFCFQDAINLTSINLKKLFRMGSYCFCSAKNLEQVNLNNLQYMDCFSFKLAENLKTINMDSLLGMEEGCFEKNEKISKLAKNNIAKNNIKKLTFKKKISNLVNKSIQIQSNENSLQTFPDEYNNETNFIDLDNCDEYEKNSADFDDCFDKKNDKYYNNKFDYYCDNIDDDDNEDFLL